MKTVFRIEHQDGQGPYSGDTSLLFSWHGVGTGRPGPMADERLAQSLKEMLNLDYVPGTWSFGHSSMTQLREWWREEDIREMSEKSRLGLSVFEVESNAFLDGSTQCIFMRRHSTRILWKRATEAFA